MVGVLNRLLLDMLTAGTSRYIPGILWISAAVRGQKRCTVSFSLLSDGDSVDSVDRVDADFNTALRTCRLSITHQLNTVRKGVIQACHGVVVV